eukprot:UN03167
MTDYSIMASRNGINGSRTMTCPHDANSQTYHLQFIAMTSRSTMTDRATITDAQHRQITHNGIIRKYKQLKTGPIANCDYIRVTLSVDLFFGSYR